MCCLHCRCGCSCCTSSGASEQSSDGASDSAPLANAADAAGAALVKAGADLLSPIEGAVLRLTDSMVTLECVDAVALFDKAEDITDGKVRLSSPAPAAIETLQCSSWGSIPCQVCAVRADHHDDDVIRRMPGKAAALAPACGMPRHRRWRRTLCSTRLSSSSGRRSASLPLTLREALRRHCNGGRTGA